MTKEQRNKVVPAPFAKRQPPGSPDREGEASRSTGEEKGGPAEAASGRRRRRWKASFMLLVLLPTMLVGLYYALIAADQYMVETRFAVRSTNPSSDSGLLSTLGLGLGGSSAGDTYIVLEYIHSREILKRIDEEIGLKRRFRLPERDFYAVLPQDATFEDFVEYWRSMVRVGLDRTSLIISVQTFAFTPQDAREIAGAILRESERMVNEISARARADAVAYAENEVRAAEERLRKIRKRFLRFRSTTQQIDPAKQAQVQLALIGKLEEQLAELQARLSEARSYLSENAPTIIYLKNRINAMHKQIREEKRKLGDRNRGPGRSRRDVATGGLDQKTLSTTLSEYEALLVEREFAEKFYLSTLSGLEQARLLANRQQRYLATFVHPYLPDEALYPKSVRNTAFVFLSLSLLWALGMLMLQSVRDRM